MEDDVSDPEPVSTESHEEEMDTWTLDLIRDETLFLITNGWGSFHHFSLVSNQMSSLVIHAMGGRPVTGCLCCPGGLYFVPHLPKEPLIL